MLVLTTGEGEVLVVQQLGDAAAAPDGDRRGARQTGGAIASAMASRRSSSVQNTDDVMVKFLLWQFSWPVWLLILVSALDGRSSASACVGYGGAGTGGSEPLTVVTLGGHSASTGGRS
jgi:hypothetical protein